MRALGILAQAPIPGRVKSRLAAEVGPSAAVEVYAQLGRRIVAATAGPGFRTVLWYAPPDEGPFIREWLTGLGRFELRPQPRGGLGQRLVAIFARLFGDGAERVVLVGTDCPGISRRVVTEAFTLLNEADVVMGPTLDGGYYLLGLRAPQPLLFRELGAGATASLTRARAAAAGLRLRQLRPLRDVDTARDARLVGLLKP